MPLAFNSLNHGTVAFGFFNIESDMLLLEHYFFFSTVFCDHVSRIARQIQNGPVDTGWEGYTIDDPEKIGDLMGAIHGIRFRGFIGDLYRRFPFPEDPGDFKQNPDGARTRAVVEKTIAPYARRMIIPFAVDRGGSEVRIGEYRFSRAVFQQLIDYVWRGGYPRWKDDIRPDYVLAMRSSVTRSRHAVFRGLVLEKNTKTTKS